MPAFVAAAATRSRGLAPAAHCHAIGVSSTDRWCDGSEASRAVRAASARLIRLAMPRGTIRIDESSVATSPPATAAARAITSRSGSSRHSSRIAVSGSSRRSTSTGSPAVWPTRPAHSRRPMPLQVAVMGASRSTGAAEPATPMIPQRRAAPIANRAVRPTEVAAQADGNASCAVGSAEHWDDAGTGTDRLQHVDSGNTPEHTAGGGNEDRRPWQLKQRSSCSERESTAPL
jgi:hypothetical protein